MNPRSPVRTCVTLGLVLLAHGLGLSDRAAAQVQYRTLALSGQPAPGTPPGVSYRFFTGLVVNDAGQAAYVATLTGSGVTETNDLAIYAGPFAAPQVVAREGDAAPGTPAGVSYLFVGVPAINVAGQSGYFARLSGSGVTNANDRVLYAGPVIAPQLVAREGDPAPGTPAGVTYGLIALTSLFEGPALNDAGQVAYTAGLTGGGVTTADSAALYAGSLTAPQLVARAGNAAPGTPEGTNYAGFSSGPALNDAGQAAYLATLTGSGVTAENDMALYAGSLTAPQLVARAGNAAPGTPEGMNYRFFSALSLNDAGQVAYGAVLIGGGVMIANSAIYAGPLAAPQLVARTGAAAPGTPAGVDYLGVSSPTLNGAGQVAYGAFFTGSGVTTANNTAIYAGPLADPRLVARTGTAVPSTPAGVSYANFFPPALNDAGQSAYRAVLTGSGVTEANDQGLFASDPTLGGLLIAREGNLFDVGGGDFRTISSIEFLGGPTDDTRAGLLNDGTLAFISYFTDGTSGIFTATIVPEPAALPLLAVAGLTLVGCRSGLNRRLL